MELNNLINPITHKILDGNSIKYFSGIPNLYFDDNISEISDANFDKLKKEILNLEKEYKF